MNDLRLPPLRIVHAAYVASDFEAGKRRLANSYDLREFAIFRETPIGVPGGEAIINIAIADASGTTVEVLHPVGGQDKVYRQVLAASPDDIVLHHFASRIENQAEWDMLFEAAGEHGIDMPVLADSEESGVRYCYLDLRAQLGHMIEYIWTYKPRADANFTAGAEVERVRR